MARDDVVVGFIGLGIMGGRMAANLQKAGYKLVVHDLQRQAASHHLNAGAAWADNPRALASRTDVILLLAARPMSKRSRSDRDLSPA
jgi:3-hydroxyisobutyrate dehydrogenase-like beta-hydroxyacid dehydrogenase